VKTNFKLKINVILKYFELQIFLTKPSVGLPNLETPFNRRVSWDSKDSVQMKIEDFYITNISYTQVPVMYRYLYR
jgi:hypothetical protein